MKKEHGLHWHICRRFFQKVMPIIPELAFCDIYIKRWEVCGSALAILVPSAEIGVLLWRRDGELKIAARELGIPAILIYEQMGSRLGEPIDCRQI